MLNLEKMPRRHPGLLVACVGSRDLGAEELRQCEDLGSQLASRGIVVVSGGALGADQAWTRGAHGADGEVVVYVPWENYEREAVPASARRVVVDELTHPQAFAEAEATLPYWGNAGQGPRKLFARNAAMFAPSSLIIAWPSKKITVTDGVVRSSGGTAFAFRYALQYGVPLLNLRKPEDREFLKQWLHGLPL